VRYLSLPEVLDLSRRLEAQCARPSGPCDLAVLESAVAHPRTMIAGKDIYLDTEDKAAALGFSLCTTHPFLDGNKRLGHAAMEVFLLLNGFELKSSVDDAARIIVRVATGACPRDEFLAWVRGHAIAAGRTQPA